MASPTAQDGPLTTHIRRLIEAVEDGGHIPSKVVLSPTGWDRLHKEVSRPAFISVASIHTVWGLPIEVSDFVTDTEARVE